MIYLGIDNGNHNVKSSNGVNYKAGIKPVIAGLAENDEWVINDGNGNSYLIGDERNAMLHDKTESSDMFLESLICIAKKIEEENEPREQKITLGIGTPLKQHKKLAKKYEDYFYKFSDFRFEWLGHEYKIGFQKVRCYPQGYAAMMHNYDLIKTYPECIIIDIGGGTIDSFKMENRKPVKSSFSTLPMGVNKLLTQIRSETDAEGINISDDMLNDAIIVNEIYHKKAEFIRSVCTGLADRFTAEILNQLRANGYDLSLPVVFMGGGYNLLKNYIKKDGSIYTVKELDSFANAKAFEWLLKEEERRNISGREKQ